MATITVGILGLGRIGASVGLALRRYNSQKGNAHQFTTFGYDPRSAVMSSAGTVNVVDTLARHYGEAVRGRDIVIMALPYAEVAAAYRTIGPDVREGAVVLDMSPLKGPSLKWSATHMPEQAYMVGVTPVLNPAYLFDGLDDTEHARADLFDKGAFMLMPAPNCAREAVELAADFAAIVGAKPHFLDPDEHDGMAAATEGLPALLGLAAFYMLNQSRSWVDTQRLTNASFGRLTHHLEDTHPDDLRDLLLNNREATLHYLDATMGVLGQLRAVLAQNDRAALEAALIESAETYNRWIARRRTGRWDDEDNGPRTNPNLMSGLVGGFLSGKMRRDQRDED